MSVPCMEIISSEWWQKLIRVLVTRHSTWPNWNFVQMRCFLPYAFLKLISATVGTFINFRFNVQSSPVWRYAKWVSVKSVENKQHWSLSSKLRICHYLRTDGETITEYKKYDIAISDEHWTCSMLVRLNYPKSGGMRLYFNKKINEIVIFNFQ